MQAFLVIVTEMAKKVGQTTYSRENDFSYWYFCVDLASVEIVNNKEYYG